MVLSPDEEKEALSDPPAAPVPPRTRLRTKTPPPAPSGDERPSEPLDEPKEVEGDLEDGVTLMKQDNGDYIEPSFNIRELKKKLLEPALSSKQRLKLLLGLHYKMRHLPAAELQRMLLKGGYGKENADLADQVLKSCSICQQWARTMTKPVAAGGIIATFFNERVQTDLFTLWGRIYIIFCD